MTDDIGGTGSGAKQSNVVGIASEFRDIMVYPVVGIALVSKAWTGRSVRLLLSGVE